MRPLRNERSRKMLPQRLLVHNWSGSYEKTPTTNQL